MKQCITSLFLILLLSCNGKTQTEVVVEGSIKEKKKEISAKAIENFKYNDYI